MVRDSPLVVHHWWPEDRWTLRTRRGTLPVPRSRSTTSPERREHSSKIKLATAGHNSQTSVKIFKLLIQHILQSLIVTEVDFYYRICSQWKLLIIVLLQKHTDKSKFQWYIFLQFLQKRFFSLNCSYFTTIHLFFKILLYESTEYIVYSFHDYKMRAVCFLLFVKRYYYR